MNYCFLKTKDDVRHRNEMIFQKKKIAIEMVRDKKRFGSQYEKWNLAQNH